MSEGHVFKIKNAFLRKHYVKTRNNSAWPQLLPRLRHFLVASFFACEREKEDQIKDVK